MKKSQLKTLTVRIENIWLLQVCTMFHVHCTVINADRYKKILMWSIPIVELIGSGFKKRTDDEIEPLLRKILRVEDDFSGFG